LETSERGSAHGRLYRNLSRKKATVEGAVSAKASRPSDGDVTVATVVQLTRFVDRWISYCAPLTLENCTVI
jgi:hypothetical protein